MSPEGKKLGQTAQHIEAGVIKPLAVIVFSFEPTNEALSYVETGRSKGKVVVKVK